MTSSDKYLCSSKFGACLESQVCRNIEFSLVGFHTYSWTHLSNGLWLAGISPRYAASCSGFNSHGSCEDVHPEDEAGEEDQAEQALAPVVSPEDWHEDPLQQIPTSLASWQDWLLSDLCRSFLALAQTSHLQLPRSVEKRRSMDQWIQNGRDTGRNWKNIHSGCSGCNFAPPKQRLRLCLSPRAAVVSTAMGAVKTFTLKMKLAKKIKQNRTQLQTLRNREAEGLTWPSRQRTAAELELAQARAAAAEAKAALAAAKADGPGGPSGPSGGAAEVAAALEPEVVGTSDSSIDFTAYSETELRPAKLLYGPEGAPLFEVLEKMEDVKELGTTSLDAVLRAWFMSLYQFSAASQAGELPADAPEDFKRNVKEVGGALKPDEIASFLMDRDKGGDWRPCVRGLAQTEFAKIMDDSLSWNVIFSNEVVTASNISMPEGRARVINFLASESFKEAGSWSDSEANAAERLIEKDPRLQRVFSRMNSVKNSIGENIRSASLAPILAIVFFIAAICFFCNGLSMSSPQNLPTDLPLMGLEK
eukprot:s492_g6.t1